VQSTISFKAAHGYYPYPIPVFTLPWITLAQRVYTGIMIEAVVIKWDNKTQTGIAKSASGDEFILRYPDGQNMYTTDDAPIPQFTGSHKQAKGYRLKMPMVGDPLLIDMDEGVQVAHPRWGYMRHYIDLMERRYGTQFVSA
jgi:hypothetical protein